MRRLFRYFSVLLIVGLSACHPIGGPDKSVAELCSVRVGGAGAGAVIGNQVNNTGPGVAVGSGFGAASGLLTGIGLDVAEQQELAMQRELDSLKVQVAANHRALRSLQRSLDNKEAKITRSGLQRTVQFDSGKAVVGPGYSEQLQQLAEEIKSNPFFSLIEVHGHADDSGGEEINMQLSEARARNVISVLVNNGISFDHIELKAHGSKLPLASNKTPPGKHLNRRVEIIVRLRI